jgi:hypothetical protein
MAAVIDYTPAHFEALHRAMARLDRAYSLRHRPFVDHYYAGGRWCALYLFVRDTATVDGTLGVELMPFRVGSQELTMGFGSNFHALRPGAGGVLFLRWMRACPLGIVFGGSPDTHRLLRGQEWTYLPGAKTYYLNAPYAARPKDGWWLTTAKWALRHTARTVVSEWTSRLRDEGASRLSVREERRYSEDLLPRRSPFAVRFAPSVAYLAWRYALDLSFVRYRLFRLLRDGESMGYVVINQAPERLIVAHCDGDDATSLAYGVLLSVVEVAGRDVRPRGVVLASSHPEMAAIYRRFGFRAKRPDRPLAIGGRTPRRTVPTDTSGWLINYDWGDNGLRAPFLDHAAAS